MAWLYAAAMLKPLGPILFLVLGLQTQLFAASLQRWVYCAQNLWVDKNITELESLFQRASHNRVLRPALHAPSGKRAVAALALELLGIDRP